MSLILGILFYTGLFLVVAGSIVVVAMNRMIRDRGRDLPLQAYSKENTVIISYRNENLNRANVLADLIRQHGLHVHMWNPLAPCSDPADKIIDMIDHVRVFVYVAPNDPGPWMAPELDYATASMCPTVTFGAEDSPEAVATEVISHTANERQLFAPAAESKVLKHTFRRRLKERDWVRAGSSSRKVTAWRHDDEMGPIILLFGTIPVILGVWLLVIWWFIR